MSDDMYKRIISRCVVGCNHLLVTLMIIYLLVTLMIIYLLVTLMIIYLLCFSGSSASPNCSAW